jgi:hypothetical protein
MTTATYLTKNRDDLRVIDQYTSSTQTVVLGDGTYAFCDGLGGFFRSVIVMIPGYDYVYGEAVASEKHTNAHDALKESAPFPKGSKLYYRDRV